MGTRFYKVIDKVIHSDEVLNKVTRVENGAVVSFQGIVRIASGGRHVQYLEYEAYTEMAESVLAQIGEEIIKKWTEVTDIAIIHRVGHLDIGDTAVFIALSAPHRAQLFDALHYAIDRIKVIAPIWKKEVWSDGTGEWKSEL